jgi:hypothetical protein
MTISGRWPASKTIKALFMTLTSIPGREYHFVAMDGIDSEPKEGRCWTKAGRKSPENFHSKSKALDAA